MTNTGILLVVFMAGMALGAFYFLNLWRTVSRMTTAPNPTAMMITNFVLRMVVVLAGFFLIMDGRWERALAAMLGFLLMRQVLVRSLGRKPRAT